jgi:iron(III)-salmochelin esterase
MSHLGRRDLVLGAVASVLAGCNGCREEGTAQEPASPSPTEPLPQSWADVSFDAGPNCPEGERAFVLTPPGASALPLLVALHGRGETGRGLEVGAGAWLRSYGMDRQYRRLLAPPLELSDLEGIVTPSRLAAINASLARTPFKGVVTVCPWCPDLEDPSPRGAARFGRFVCDDLLPRVRSLLGSTVDRTRTGIDGISMGGREALLVGLTNPEVFGVVGAMQPALGKDEAAMVSALAKAAMAKAPVRLRLLTSDADYFRDAVQATSDRLRADGVPHEMIVVMGDHGYEFNRGPGGVEMLLWHDRLGQGVTPV